MGRGGAFAGKKIEARKRLVMEAAESLISEQGYDVVRLRDIAKKAGVSVGLIQHYFDSRECLLLETMSASSWRRAEEWSKLGSDIKDPARRLHAMLRGSIGEPDRCVSWMNICTAATRHKDLLPLVSHIYDAWLGAFQTTIQNGIETGAFKPDIPPSQALDTIMATIDGLMISAGLGMRGFDYDHAVTILEDVAGRLLRFDFVSLRLQPAGSLANDISNRTRA